MIATRRLRSIAHRRGDDGAALMLVLVLVFAIGVIAAASVTYASTSLHATNAAYIPARAQQNDADSAVRTAIEYVKKVEAAGGSVGTDFGGPCPTLTYPGQSGTVTTSLCPQNDSLIHSGEYRASLLTLGTDPSEGITLSHNGTVRINGAVFSNSILSLANPTTLAVTGGPVWAWGNCVNAGNVVISSPSGSAQCNASATFGGVRPKVALDPADPSLGHTADWQPAAAAPASLVQPAIPACVANAATLTPGVYYDPVALSALTTSCNTVTLGPGVYWLDFPSSATPWTISKTVTASCDASGQGAQLVLANQAKFALTGTLSLPCGRRATANGPRIALYELTAPIAGGGPYSTVLRPTTAVDTNGGYFTATAANALPGAGGGYPADGTQATASVSKNKTAELTLGTFTNTSGPSLTAGAQLASVTVKIAHDEQSGMSLSPAPVLRWGSCSASLATTTSAGETTWTSANLTSTFATCASSSTATMSLAWDASTPHNPTQNWTADLDGAEVDVTWSDAGIPAQSGCMTTVGGCSVIDPGSNSGELDASDVVYLPQDMFSGTLNNASAAKFGAAAILRAVDLRANPNVCLSCTQVGGDTSTPLPGKLVITASIAGTPWIDSQVEYDPATFAPTIDTWLKRF